jgi:putative transposase
MSMFKRERTSVGLVMYALYIYFLGLSFRNTSKALEPFKEKRSYVVVCGVGYNDLIKIIYCRKTRVAAFIIDETMIQIGGGSSEAWLWIAIESVHSTILGASYLDIEIC